MSFFFIISEGGFFVLAFFEFVQQLSWTALLQFLPYTFEFGLAIAIWYLKDRFRRRISYFYLVALIFQLAHTVCMEGFGEEDPEKKEASVKFQFEFLMRITAVFCFFAAPSMIFCHIYVLSYIVSVQCLVLLRGGYSDPVFRKNLLDVP